MVPRQPEPGIKNKLAVTAAILTCWSASGCANPPQPPPSVVEAAPCAQDETDALMKKNERLEQALTDSQERIRSLEHDIADLKMRILAYEAQIQDLNRRADMQQKRLDAAIVEVVRAKAKLRSLESKAEAASTLAEAELAAKSLKSQVPEANSVLTWEITAVDQLLAMSIEEFKAQNYGGALFLANQVKGQVRAAQARLSRSTNGDAVEGESPFAQPLKLRLLKNSNLRQGPGLDQKIVATLDQDTTVMGHAFKGDWVRVETRDGVCGWIFQGLVGAP